VVAWIRIRCCVAVGTGRGCEVRMREVTGAGEVYVAVGEPVKRSAFIVLGVAILSCDFAF
jgi:hypothetical protein